jgi:hypothetical protein
LKTNSSIEINRQKRPPAVLGGLSKSSSPIGKESFSNIPARTDRTTMPEDLNNYKIITLSNIHIAAWKKSAVILENPFNLACVLLAIIGIDIFTIALRNCKI